MRAVGLEHAEVLHEDQLAPGGEHGGDHDGDHAHAIHVDAGCVGHGHVLAHGAELLAEAGADVYKRQVRTSFSSLQIIPFNVHSRLLRYAVSASRLSLLPI